MKAHEVALTSELVQRVFLEHGGPVHGQEGIDEFLEYAAPVSIQRRLPSGSTFSAAWLDEKRVGLIELREAHHISLLFVDTAHQCRGIARQLLSRSLRICRAERRVSAKSTSMRHPTPSALTSSWASGKQVRSGPRTRYALSLWSWTLRWALTERGQQQRSTAPGPRSAIVTA